MRIWPDMFNWWRAVRELPPAARHIQVTDRHAIDGVSLMTGSQSQLGMTGVSTPATEGRSCDSARTR